MAGLLDYAGAFGAGLSSLGATMQGRPDVGQRMWNAYMQKERIDQFRSTVANMGADPDNPLTWNEDVLAKGLNMGVLEPKEAVALGVNLARMRLEQQRLAQAQKQWEKTFEWDKTKALLDQYNKNRNYLLSIKPGTPISQGLASHFEQVGLVPKKQLGAFDTSLLTGGGGPTVKAADTRNSLLSMGVPDETRYLAPGPPPKEKPITSWAGLAALDPERFKEMYRTAKQIEAETTKQPKTKQPAIAQKYEFLVSKGVPKIIARAVAAGTVKTIEGWEGTALVDVASNKVLGWFTDQEGWRPNPEVYGGADQAEQSARYAPQETTPKLPPLPPGFVLVQ